MDRDARFSVVSAEIDSRRPSVVVEDTVTYQRVADLEAQMQTLLLQLSRLGKSDVCHE